MKFEKLSSIFLILMYIIAPAHAFELFGHEVNVDTGDVASLAVGAAVAGAAIVLAPVEVPALVVAGVAIGGGIAANYIYRELTGKNSNDGAAVTDGKTPTTSDMKDEDVINKLAEIRGFSNEKAAQDLFILRQDVASSLTTYDFESSGSLADIRLSLKGAGKIYGFSAFPTVINIYAPAAPDPSENKVHIQKITTYVKDIETGQTWWKQTWTGDQILRNSDYTWNFLLKTPDPYYGKAKAMATGTADRKTLEELLNAKVNKFEVCVEVEGYREVWAWVEITKTNPDGSTYISKEKRHIDDIPINAQYKSLSAWKHINNGKYYIRGTTGSLPAKFAFDRNYTAYAAWANGATSNIIGRVWATPVHLFDSTADYKYVFIGLPDNFKPIPATISDDFKMAAFRIQKDNTSYISSQSPVKFGDLSNINLAASSLYYKTDNNTVSFDSYALVYATVNDLPLWCIIKPQVSVLSNQEVVLGDTQTNEILEIINDSKITDNEIQTLKNLVDSSITSLTEKKNSAISFSQKCKTYNRQTAASYADKASTYYEKAIEQLSKLKSTNDAAQIATSYKLSKNYEMIGDYYSDAAQKEFYGQSEQALADIENAQKLEELTKQYEPSMFFTAGSWLGDSWQSFKEGFGIGNIPDWVLILVVVIVIVGGAVIVLKLF
ncbi:hypothetical protein Mjas_01540 [Methanothermococcus sp. Ax23]|uniref:hypothetical protein n=1 Tax=Methanothermococcus sp. Ax23 TaxID=3156486 RepID=UPI003BA1CFFE